MLRTVVFGFVMALIIGLAMVGDRSADAQSTPVPSNASDEAAVRAVLEAQLAAWAAGDGDAFASTVTDDSDLIAFDGTHLVGRQEIASFMQQQFETVLAGTQVVAEPVRIRFIGDDSAVMITRGGVIFPGETEAPAERDSIQTFVLSKQDGRWLVEAFQNTRIALPQS